MNLFKIKFALLAAGFILMLSLTGYALAGGGDPGESAAATVYDEPVPPTDPVPPGEPAPGDPEPPSEQVPPSIPGDDAQEPPDSSDDDSDGDNDSEFNHGHSVREVAKDHDATGSKELSNGREIENHGQAVRETARNH